MRRPIHIQIIVHYKYTTTFRQVIDTKKLEWCSIMDGSEKNPLINFIIDQTRETCGNLYHTCPYDGELNLINVTADGNKYDRKSQVFPDGIYRNDLYVFKDDLQMFKLSIGYEVKTGLKETFG